MKLRKHERKVFRRFMVNRLVGCCLLEGSSLRRMKTPDINSIYIDLIGTDAIYDMREESRKRKRMESESKLESNMGYVYLITCKKTMVCKIGFSKNPHKRISTLQVGYPFQLVLEDYKKGSMLDEKNLHKANKKHKLNGEWFNRNGIVF